MISITLSHLSSSRFATDEHYADRVRSLVSLTATWTGDDAVLTDALGNTLELATAPTPAPRPSGIRTAG